VHEVERLKKLSSSLHPTFTSLPRNSGSVPGTLEMLTKCIEINNLLISYTEPVQIAELDSRKPSPMVSPNVAFK